MEEHSGRYEQFARYLNNRGYIVYANDHRGHGKTETSKETLGYLGKDGFNKIVEDEYIITNLIKDNHKNIPIYVFAHSFGSFIGQEYITRYSNIINGIILSGSAKKSGLDVKFGRALTKIFITFADEKNPANVIEKLSFGRFNKMVKEPKSEFSWLTRDTKAVNKYMKDEKCGFPSSLNFYNNLFDGFSELYRTNKLESINIELPILILSGDMDPVGKYGKSAYNLYNQYSALGIKNVSIKLYKEARHELINEINKDEVYEFILKWMESN